MGAMRRCVRGVAGAIFSAAVLAPQAANAQATWDLACSTAGLGIATFATCASAQLTMTGVNTYELRFWNRAGENGTFGDATVTAIGFGNTGGVTGSNLGAFRVNGSGYDGWAIDNGGGGIPGPSGANGFSISGINSGIVSDVFAGALQDRERTDWSPAGFSAGFVRFTFNTSAAINLANVTLDLHVQGGPNGQSTGYSCPVTSATSPCGPGGGGGTGNVVPEPSTYVLLGSGLLGILGIAARRRRQV